MKIGRYSLLVPFVSLLLFMALSAAFHPGHHNDDPGALLLQVFFFFGVPLILLYFVVLLAFNHFLAGALDAPAGSGSTGRRRSSLPPRCSCSSSGSRFFDYVNGGNFLPRDRFLVILKEYAPLSLPIFLAVLINRLLVWRRSALPHA